MLLPIFCCSLENQQPTIMMHTSSLTKHSWSSFKVPFPENCHYLNCLVVLLKNSLRRLLFIWCDSEFAQCEVFFLWIFVENNWQQLLTIELLEAMDNKRAKIVWPKSLKEKTMKYEIYRESLWKAPTNFWKSRKGDEHAKACEHAKDCVHVQKRPEKVPRSHLRLALRLCTSRK